MLQVFISILYCCVYVYVILLWMEYAKSYIFFVSFYIKKFYNRIAESRIKVCSQIMYIVV